MMAHCWEGQSSLLPWIRLFTACHLRPSSYATGSFNAYVDTNRNYATWFTESSAGPIIGDVLMSKGRVLGGSIYAQLATGAKWRAHAKALHAKVTKLEATLTTREAHMQEETAQALAQENEL